MGLCHGKQIQNRQNRAGNPAISWNTESLLNSEATQSSNFTLYSPSPLSSFFKNSPASSSVNSTPLRIFKRPFPRPSPAKHIKALLFRRHGSIKPNEASIPEENELGLDKNFGLSKQLFAKYVLGEEIGRGHFGYTCSAIAKKGEQKGQEVAVKVIPKSKKLSMTHIKSMAVMISPWEMEMCQTVWSLFTRIATAQAFRS